MNREKKLQQGAVTGATILSVVLGVLALGLGIVATWALISYNDWRSNVQSRIDAAVAEARQQQSAEDEQRFAEREKEPYDRFIGPDDLGRVEFNYPKTWSVHIASDGGGARSFDAYLHPGVVPPISSQTQYALRVKIENRAYEDIIRSFESRVERGELRSSAITVSGYNGTRLDGNFSRNVEDGSIAFFKVRDKTLSVATDAPAYRPDFNNIILSSLTFSP